MTSMKKAERLIEEFKALRLDPETNEHDFDAQAMKIARRLGGIIDYLSFNYEDMPNDHEAEHCFSWQGSPEAPALWVKFDDGSCAGIEDTDDYHEDAYRLRFVYHWKCA